MQGNTVTGYRFPVARLLFESNHFYASSRISGTDGRETGKPVTGNWQPVTYYPKAILLTPAPLFFPSLHSPPVPCSSTRRWFPSSGGSLTRSQDLPTDF
jgi:hypothetical protein